MPVAHNYSIKSRRKSWSMKQRCKLLTNVYGLQSSMIALVQIIAAGDSVHWCRRMYFPTVINPRKPKGTFFIATGGTSEVSSLGCEASVCIPAPQGRVLLFYKNIDKCTIWVRFHILHRRFTPILSSVLCAPDVMYTRSVYTVLCSLLYRIYLQVLA